MANPMAQLLKVSATKRAGVVLLKPCFSSRMKVWYIPKGRVGIMDVNVSTKTNNTDCRI